MLTFDVNWMLRGWFWFGLGLGGFLLQITRKVLVTRLIQWLAVGFWLQKNILGF